MLNGGRVKAFPLISGGSQGCTLSALLSKKVLKALARVIGQKIKRKKKIKEVKLSFLVGNEVYKTVKL